LDSAVKTFADLEDVLGYNFKDRSLLLRALTHTSFANENYKKDSRIKSNERTEFVGDAVLGLIVGTYIYCSFPNMPEGKMSKLRASVVCEATLAKLACALQIDKYLRLGIGEEQTGGRTKPSLLADAFESVLGAVYLDGGFEAAQEAFLPLLIPEITEREVSSFFSDYKSALQELLGKKHTVAQYTIVDTRGPDHDRIFTAEVVAGDVVACGEGKTKKEAEQNAAQKALLLLESLK